MHEKPQLSCHSNGGRKTNFVKYNANGNDFIIIDGKDLELSTEQQLDWLVKRASFLCDRHAGIGADGILLLNHEGTSLCMNVINADGSVAKNCGNGLRSVAQWWFGGLRTASLLTIELAGRYYLCSKKDDLISIDMGECDIERLSDFVPLSGEAVVYKAHLGNAHLVFVSEEALNVESALAEIKQKYTNWADFNIGFISRASRQSIVYERGVGFTKSCGSGAIAAALALRMDDTSLSHMTIHQPGGDISLNLYPLVCSHMGAKFRVSQSGGAVEVFRGHITV